MGGSIGSAISGIGGLFALSDKRAKENISKVGNIRGQDVFAYRYKGGGPMQLGLMAQEVEKKMPSAVITGADGFKRVNYSKALSLGS